MTIHHEHPFSDPPEVRDPGRQLRGRLAVGVTLWTSGSLPDRAAGLTVSSVLVAPGSPVRVLALLDPLSDLSETMIRTSTALLAVLQRPHRRLADVFAGQSPAPGGTFAQAEFTGTPWGPLPVGVGTWAGLRREATQEVGWSSLVTCVVEQLHLGQDAEPLVHYRGRYSRLG